MYKLNPETCMEQNKSKNFIRTIHALGYDDRFDVKNSINLRKCEPRKQARSTVTFFNHYQILS